MKAQLLENIASTATDTNADTATDGIVSIVTNNMAEAAADNIYDSGDAIIA